MIKKLYECGCFDYREFILTHQKQLLLSPAAAVVLIEMLDQYQESKYFSVASIMDKLSITDSEFDKSVTNLLEREYYTIYVQYEEGIGKEAISLDGFFNRVRDILEDKNPKDIENELFQVTQFIQKEINRLLTAEELEIASSLIAEDNFSFSDIEEGMKYMKEHYKVLSVKNLVASLSRFREEPRKESGNVPDFYKDFLKSIR